MTLETVFTNHSTQAAMSVWSCMCTQASVAGRWGIILKRISTIVATFIVLNDINIICCFIIKDSCRYSDTCHFLVSPLLLLIAMLMVTIVVLIVIHTNMARNGLQTKLTTDRISVINHYLLRDAPTIAEATIETPT